MALLDNITVLSLEQATVVPYLSYRLAQDGMQVIRLEHPVYGDPNRMIGENVLGEERMNAYFLCINAGKKSLTLDLSGPEGKDIFYRLLETLDVDIFVTNQLPKNYAKLGIDYASIAARKSDIIWLGVTGFGPDSNEGAYDPILQARSGLMDLTGDPDGDPQVIGIPLPDMGTSEHAYGLLMKALFKRQLSGKGTRIDLSMFESSVSWLTVPITLTASFDQSISRKGNTHAFFCPVSVYQTLDGYVYLAVGNDRQWAAMVALEPFKALDRPAYAHNAGRIQDVVQLNRRLNEITKTIASERLLDLFRSITVPISNIKRIPEVIADPLVKRRLLSTTDPISGKRVTLAPPPCMTPFLERAQRELSFPPRFGEHNQEIYGDRLGIRPEMLERLRSAKVIS